MADADVIKSIKSKALGLLDDIMDSPKPSYNIDGQNVEWADYIRVLQEKVEWCDTMLAGLEPFEIHHQGYT